MSEPLERKAGDVAPVAVSVDGELQHVLDGIVETDAQLFGARHAHLHLVDGDQYRRVAHFGELLTPELVEWRPIGSADTTPGQAIRERRPIHVEDAQTLPGGTAKAMGVRTLLSVPLLSADEAIGALQ